VTDPAISLVDAVPAEKEPWLTSEQIKNLALASVGAFLELYEFMVFGFFTVVIAKLFFPPDLPEAMKIFQAFALYSLGYLLRPVSGAIIGHLGDKFGRKRTFIITIVIMAVPTTFIGLMPTYAQIGILAPICLLLLRLLQGIALSGEFAGAGVFVSEHAPTNRLGVSSSVLIAASWLGFFLGAGSGAFLSKMLSPADLESWGWRLPFLIGGILGFVSVYLRRSLDETPLFKEVRRRRDPEKSSPFRKVVNDYPGRVAYVAGLGTYFGTVLIVVYFYLPTLLVTHGFDRGTVFTANASALLFAAVMCPLWGWIADRIGYGWVLGVGAAGLSSSLALFFQMHEKVAAAPETLMWWYLAFAAFTATISIVPLLCAMPFPTELRLTGFGFGYNIGVVISAAAPTILAWIVLTSGNMAIVSYFSLALGAIGLVLALVTPYVPFLLDKEIER
jgi:MFS family permease